MKSTKFTITKPAFDAVVTAPVRNLLKTGILNSQFVDPDDNDFYDYSSATRAIFSDLCYGMKVAIDGCASPTMKANRCKTGRWKYIEIYNKNFVIHLRNTENKNPLPDYMREKCKLNYAFRPGKQNYVVIGFEASYGELHSGFDWIVYDVNGIEVYREKLMDLSMFTTGSVA